MAVVEPEVYGSGWLVPAGDRLGVLVTSANDGWWAPAPTQTQVTVNSGSISAYLKPFLATRQRPFKFCKVKVMS